MCKFNVIFLRCKHIPSIQEWSRIGGKGKTFRVRLEMQFILGAGKREKEL